MTQPFSKAFREFILKDIQKRAGGLFLFLRQIKGFKALMIVCRMGKTCGIRISIYKEIQRTQIEKWGRAGRDCIFLIKND